MAIEEVWIDEPGAGFHARIFRCSNAQHPAVLLLPDAAGLRPSIIATASRVAGWGYHVILPDFYADLGEPPLNIGEVFAHGDDWQRMNRMRASLTHEWIDPKIVALLERMGCEPWIRSDALACVGLSFGGRFALAAAANSRISLKLAASIHGGGLATAAFDSPHLRAATMSGQIYVAAAEYDSQMPPEELQRLSYALSQAGRSFEIETFLGTRHGFSTPESAAFNAEATAQLWEAVHARLDRTLLASEPTA
jgi:carboxymethylenebutenolidase